jgi:hypothetical protein
MGSGSLFCAIINWFFVTTAGADARKFGFGRPPRVRRASLLVFSHSFMCGGNKKEKFATGARAAVLKNEFL